jgi:hypothetical protein
MNPVLMPQKNNTPSKDLTSGTTDVEKERLRRDIYRSDMEKLRLFTQMLRTNALYKKAKISHK